MKITVHGPRPDLAPVPMCGAPLRDGDWIASYWAGLVDCTACLATRLPASLNPDDVEAWLRA